MSESGKTSGTRDVITDFKHGTDNLDLHSIAGKFHLLAGERAAFTHTKGDLHFLFSGSNTIVEGDINGNGTADFQIELKGHVTLTSGDIIP